MYLKYKEYVNTEISPVEKSGHLFEVYNLHGLVSHFLVVGDDVDGGTMYFVAMLPEAPDVIDNRHVTRTEYQHFENTPKQAYMEYISALVLDKV